VFDLAMANEDHAARADDLLAAAVAGHNRADTRALAFSQCRLIAVRLRWTASLTPAIAEESRAAGELVAGLRSQRAATDLQRIVDLLEAREQDESTIGLLDDLTGRVGLELTPTARVLMVEHGSDPLPLS